MINETEAAVKRELGVDAVIECVYDKEKTKKQLLYEISICLTKEFELISCNKKEVSETTCPRKEPFFYPPVHDDFPQIDISVI